MKSFIVFLALINAKLATCVYFRGSKAAIKLFASRNRTIPAKSAQECGAFAYGLIKENKVRGNAFNFSAKESICTFGTTGTFSGDLDLLTRDDHDKNGIHYLTNTFPSIKPLGQNWTIFMNFFDDNVPRRLHFNYNGITSIHRAVSEQPVANMYSCCNPKRKSILKELPFPMPRMAKYPAFKVNTYKVEYQVEPFELSSFTIFVWWYWYGKQANDEDIMQIFNDQKAITIMARTAWSGLSLWARGFSWSKSPALTEKSWTFCALSFDSEVGESSFYVNDVQLQTSEQGIRKGGHWQGLTKIKFGEIQMTLPRAVIELHNVAMTQEQIQEHKKVYQTLFIK